MSEEIPEDIKDLFKDVPFRHVSPIEMKEPNESIPVYNGKFTLNNDDKQYQLEGTIEFRWFPTGCVRFFGDVIAESKESAPLKLLEEFILSIDGNKCGKVVVLNFKLPNSPSISGEGNKFSLGQNTIAVNEVSFAIPNMREYLGDAVQNETSTGVSMQKTRLTLKDNPYTITIDQISGYKGLLEKLSNTSGYLLLYAGKIVKDKGAISLSELQKWHDRFHHFLYFLNGRRVAPMFYTGIHEGEKMWTDYTGYTVDMYKNTISWSDIIFLNDLPQLWAAYNKLWREEMDKDFLITVIHWYVEANSMAGSVEGSIILIQTALELIYNWLIVEREKVILGNDADGLSAANKIRMIIHQLKVKSEIPPAFTELATIPNVQDGPEVFVKIRNALVHGQETKRAELLKISLKAKYQALQLGIWYVELSLLYILDYKGKYNNRTDGNNWRNTGTFVPWVNK